MENQKMAMAKGEIMKNIGEMLDEKMDGPNRTNQLSNAMVGLLNCQQVSKDEKVQLINRLLSSQDIDDALKQELINLV